MLPEIPTETLRLFAHYDQEALGTDEASDFVVLRLAEEGDRADLAWLVGRVGVARLTAVFERHGRRQLSARSRAFWQTVLDLEADAPSSGGDLWAP